MMEKAQLLIVDDEPASRYGIKKALSHLRFNFQEAATGKEALDKMVALAPEIVIIDINLPELDGLSVLSEAKKQSLPSVVIVITAYGSEKIAVDAMTFRACEFSL